MTKAEQLYDKCAKHRARAKSQQTEGKTDDPTASSTTASPSSAAEAKTPTGTQETKDDDAALFAGGVCSMLADDDVWMQIERAHTLTQFYLAQVQETNHLAYACD